MPTHQPKTLSEWLTHGYLLVVRDEETFEERISTRINRARVVLVGFFLFILTFGMAYVVSGVLRSATMNQNVQHVSQQALALGERVDSLQEVIRINEQYVQNLQRVLHQQIEVKPVEEELAVKSVSVDPEDLQQISEVDRQFRTNFEGSEEELSSASAKANILGEMFFFPPVRGIISKNYDVRTEHYGVDIVAPKDEPIKAVMEGTVILASWTQDSGYVIGIQHDNQLLSFYKHNSILLKKVGEFVKTGDPIAIIGNSGEYTDGPHLHFELWYKGNHVDPLAFVKF